MLAEDGSGKGAGLVSSIAQRISARLDETPISTAHTVKKDHQRHHHQVNGCAKVHTNGVNGFHNGSITSAVNGHTNGYSNGH